MSNDSEKHSYYANAIGFVAFCAFLTFSIRSCNEHDIEKEKTKQIEITHDLLKNNGFTIQIVKQKK